MTTGYPAILLLDGRTGVVVAGGALGERKVRTLLDAGARARVITTDPTDSLRLLAKDGTIELLERAYEPADLDGSAVVIASTGDRGTDLAVYGDATARGIPVNVVDDPEHCSFIAPSMVRRGDLLIAISTGGTSPALAVRIKERLQDEFDDSYARLLGLIRRLKDEVRLAPTPEERAAAWYRVVDSDVLDLVRAGKDDQAYARAVELLGAGS